eukprot:tig00000113_g5679.t1
MSGFEIYIDPEILEEYVAQKRKAREIVALLHEEHQIQISMRALRYKLSDLDLSTDYSLSKEAVYDVVEEAATLCGDGYGYDAIRGALRAAGITVAKSRIQHALAELDPTGRNVRLGEFAKKRRSIHRSTFYGKFFGWSVGFDQNEKAVPYTNVYIFAAVENTSTFILDLHCGLARSTIQGYKLYKSVVEEFGVFDTVSSDCGAENRLTWTAHALVLEETERLIDEEIAKGNITDPTTGLPWRRLNFEDPNDLRDAVMVGPSYRNPKVEKNWRWVNVKVTKPIVDAAVMLEMLEWYNRLDPQQLFAMAKATMYVMEYGLAIAKNSWNHHVNSGSKETGGRTAGQTGGPVEPDFVVFDEPRTTLRMLRDEMFKECNEDLKEIWKHVVNFGREYDEEAPGVRGRIAEQYSSNPLGGLPRLFLFMLQLNEQLSDLHLYDVSIPGWMQWVHDAPANNDAPRARSMQGMGFFPPDEYLLEPQEMRAAFFYYVHNFDPLVRGPRAR